jgi:hypothetical protein
MTRNGPLTLFAVGLVIGLQPPHGVLAQTASPDKRDYTIFNPVPAELLRPLSADRPDTTESPYTVDAGHVQIESSVFDWVRDGDDDTLTIASLNFKVGLLHNLDIQFIVDPYVRSDAEGAGNGGVNDGFGDSQIRLKLNLWGNDGGRTAMAVMPFIKVPTADEPLGNGEVDGGVILPFSIDLTEGLSLGLMAEFDAVYDEDDDNYDLGFVHTAVLGFDLTERVGAFVEYVGVWGSDSSIPYSASTGAGVTFALNDNCQLDCGLNFALNDATDDFNPFAGFTIRF